MLLILQSARVLANHSLDHGLGCGGNDLNNQQISSRWSFGDGHPKNVVVGTSRPDRWSNIFVSDPEGGSPALLELRWPQPVISGYVQVTFDTDVNRRVERPLFRCPDCVKRYDIAFATGGGWKVIAEEGDNYNRWRSHTFDPIHSDRLRIQVYETNGAKSARIYEVRVYEHP